jgi:hypothetical protein
MVLVARLSQNRVSEYQSRLQGFEYCDANLDTDHTYKANYSHIHNGVPRLDYESTRDE